MHSPAIAILPEGMSQERFDWLKSINAEIVKTPDSESSIKGVLDECNKMVKNVIKWLKKAKEKYLL